ncbi:hypothetical protein SAY87_006160 [Trapa incisa]|uniref:Uncharacterized protein n=1 Tax=Trapa incisa TaxID=236973 RepID=A0AAN7Q890_9MYRT|nr:hypothetical protein SAY87_006160 [Trapa incisa]
MSIVIHRSGVIGVESSPSIGGQASMFDTPEFHRRSKGEEADAAGFSSSSESSSIGKNSDASLVGGIEEDDEEDNEVQSSYRGPLEMMNALEEVLPRKRSISNFYDGKSKSYMNLNEASSSSNAKEIVKPDNPYNRRRRNLLAYNQIWEKNRNSLKSNAGGISKRPLSSSRSTLALAVVMSSSESYSSTSEDSGSSSASLSRSPPPSLPPLHPQGKNTLGHISSPRRGLYSWRSYSVADLQNCSNPLALVQFKDPIVEKADLEDLV